MQLTPVQQPNSGNGSLSPEMVRDLFNRHAAYFDKGAPQTSSEGAAAPAEPAPAQPVPGIGAVDPPAPEPIPAAEPVVAEGSAPKTAEAATAPPLEVPQTKITEVPEPPVTTTDAPAAPNGDDFDWEAEQAEISRKLPEKAKSKVAEKAPKSYVEAINQRFNADFKDESDFESYIKDLQERANSYDKLQEEVKQSSAYVNFSDPVLRQVVDLYQGSKNIDDLVSNLSLLQADPMKKNEQGQFVIPAANIIRDGYLKEGLSAEEVEDLISSKSPAELAVLAMPIRKAMAETRKQTLTAFESAKAQKAAMDQVEAGHIPQEEIQERLRVVETSLRGVKAINGRAVPEKFVNDVVVPLALSPQFIQELFYDESGKPRAEVIADALVRYHPSITEKAREHLTAPPKVDLERLKREWRAELTKERITPSAPPLDTAPPAPSSRPGDTGWWKNPAPEGTFKPKPAN